VAVGILASKSVADSRKVALSKPCKLHSLDRVVRMK